MTRTIVYCALAGAAALWAAWAGLGAAPRPAARVPPVIDARLAEAGPYAERIQMRRKAGGNIVVAEASRVSVQKGKVFVFESALMRRPVAEDLRVTVYREGEKLFEMTKDREMVSRDLAALVVREPRILYPENLRADRVSIEPDGAVMLETDGVRERLPGS